MATKLFISPRFLASRPQKLAVALGLGLIAIVGAAAVYFASAAGPQPVGQTSSWNLIFNDEFTGTTLDTTKWNTCYPYAPPSNCSHGSELQWYQPQNVTVAGGLLRLTAKRERVIGDGRGYDYTSGMVTSAHKFSFQYGYAEMRAKLTKGKGMWPAFWMLPQDISWPPEIDIMEHLGHEPNRVHMGYHWGTHLDKKNQGSSYLGPDFSAGFHTFGVDWSPQTLIYYVNGREVYRYTDAANITSKPMFLLANLAVGGDWPGAPNATAVFPQTMQVDYIRAWQKAPSRPRPRWSQLIPTKAFTSTRAPTPSAQAQPHPQR